MYHFFVENSQLSPDYKEVQITGSDYNHIANVLRMKVGEQFSVSILSDDHRTIVTDHKGNRYDPLIGFSKLTAPLENESRFCLINRGILVNMDYIRAIEDGICILQDNSQYPVKIRELTQINQAISDYRFSKE